MFCDVIKVGLFKVGTPAAPALFYERLSRQIAHRGDLEVIGSKLGGGCADFSVSRTFEQVLLV